MRLSLWNKCDADTILINGDQLYKSVNRTDYLSVPDLPGRFKLGPLQVQVEYVGNKCGLLEHNFLILGRELASVLRTDRCIVFHE